MINEFSAHARPTHNKGKIAFLIAISAAAVLVVFSLRAENYSGLIGLAAIIFLTAALFIFTKYVAVEYYYDITVSDGEPLFVVRQAVGKRRTTMSRIALADIASVELEDTEKRKSHKTAPGYLKYAYVPTLMPNETIRITVSARYEKAEIVIEGNREFAELISRYAAEAKSLYPDEEE